MAITYSWQFPTLDVTYNGIIQETGDAVQNVVSTVHWVYTAQDGNHTATMYGTVSLPAPGQPFIDYGDLTPEIVQGWVEAALGADEIARMQLSFVGMIEAKKQPKSGSMSPPWQ